LVSYGLPAEGVGILIAVDAVPDMFKTLANVTAYMTSTALIARAPAGAPAASDVAAPVARDPRPR
jgi:Na+/H+-dicarboxylate symporter